MVIFCSKWKCQHYATFFLDILKTRIPQIAPIFFESLNSLISFLDLIRLKSMSVKGVRTRSYSGPYFLPFSPNAEKYGPE